MNVSKRPYVPRKNSNGSAVASQICKFAHATDRDDVIAGVVFGLEFAVDVRDDAVEHR